MSAGRLYLVPNTLDLGAPEATWPALDEVLSAGVIRVAARLPHWVVENAKSTRQFLKRVDALVPLALPLQQVDIRELPRPPKGGAANGISSADDAAWESLLAPALAGIDMGLLSEAGLPGVADPGARLVAAAHRRSLQVVPLPGPSSLVLALAASGLQGQSFAFVGYLPVEAAARAQRLKELEAVSRRQQQTQLVIETPYRNEALTAAMADALSASTLVTISAGLTLVEGWSRTLSVAEWRQQPPRFARQHPAVFGLLGR